MCAGIARVRVRSRELKPTNTDTSIPVSDDFLVFVPKDPDLVPSSEAQMQAIQCVRSMLPAAERVESQQSARVQFHDCAGNFESVFCPHCRAPLSLDWWGATMDHDFRDGGFVLATYEMPCCRLVSNLNELHYNWPQAFGRFAITAQNPGVVEIPASLVAAIETALCCRVTAVRRHL